MLLDSSAGLYFDNEARARAHEAVSLRQQKLPEDALRVLAQEVIARLASRCTVAEPDLSAPTDGDIEFLADALISDEPDAGLSFVLDLRRQDISRDVVYLGYIAGAARCLGERWVSDEIPFTDVNLAAGRLYIIMRALRPTFITEVTQGTGIVLFASAPGEDHTLGVTMAADMFRERGWQIDLHTGLDHDELVEIAARGRYSIIGLSASSNRMIVPLTRLIASFRLTCPASAVLVSGELTTIEPDLAKIVDADSVVTDTPSAILEMKRLSESLSKCSSH